MPRAPIDEAWVAAPAWQASPCVAAPSPCVVLHPQDVPMSSLVGSQQSEGRGLTGEILLEQQEEEIARFLDCLELQAQNSELPSPASGEGEVWVEAREKPSPHTMAAHSFSNVFASASAFAGVTFASSFASASTFVGSFAGATSADGHTESVLWMLPEAVSTPPSGSTTRAAESSVKARGSWVEAASSQAAAVGAAPQVDPSRIFGGATASSNQHCIDGSFGNGAQSFGRGSSVEEETLRKQDAARTDSTVDASNALRDRDGTTEWLFASDHSEELRTPPQQTANSDWQAKEFSPEDVVLIPCSFCGRGFHEDRLPKHEGICRNVTVEHRRRPVFESQSQRCKELQGRLWLQENVEKSPAPPPSPVPGVFTSSPMPRLRHPSHDAPAARGAGATQRVPAKTSTPASSPVSSATASCGRATRASPPEVVLQRPAWGYNSSRSASVPSLRASVAAIKTSPKARSPDGVAASRARSTPAKAGRKHEPQVGIASGAKGQDRGNVGALLKDGNGGNGFGRRLHTPGARKDHHDKDNPAAVGTHCPSLCAVDEKLVEDGWRQSSNEFDFRTPPRRFDLSVEYGSEVDAQKSAEKTALPERAEHKGMSPAHFEAAKKASGAWTQPSDMEASPDLQRFRSAVASCDEADYGISRDEFFSSVELPPHSSSGSGSRRASGYHTEAQTWQPDASPKKAEPHMQGDDPERWRMSATYADLADLLPSWPPPLPRLDARPTSANVQPPQSGRLSGAAVPAAENSAQGQGQTPASSSSENFKESLLSANSWGDAAPLRFSDPAVLSTMMADVKLLGAHVDHLIDVQQRLLGKEPKPLDSLDARIMAATSSGTGPATWPSHPYDPARYGGHDEGEASFERMPPLSPLVRDVEGIRMGSMALGSPPTWCVEGQGPDGVDAELRSAVDSLEQRSELFQSRIRECAQHIEARREEGKKV